MLNSAWINVCFQNTLILFLIHLVQIKHGLIGSKLSMDLSHHTVSDMTAQTVKLDNPG